MQNPSNFQEEYIKYLHQTFELRKEIHSLSKSITAYKDSNQSSKQEIYNLQQSISDLENELEDLKAYSDSANVSLLTNSISGDTSTVSLINQSITYKKYPTKDSEFDNFVPTLPSHITEERHLKHFEFFCIIGPDKAKVEANKSLTPEILFTYPEFSFKNTPNASALKALAFPSGLFAKNFNNNESDGSQINEVLYHSHYRDGNSFIFTIEPFEFAKGFDITGMVNNDMSTLYCCCVIFDDLLLNSYFGIQFIVPRCYCFLTFFPCFELHFEVLYRLLAIRRTKLFEITASISGPSDAYSDIELVFKDEGLGLLEMYYEYNCDNTTSQYLDVSIFLQSVEGIEYSFPSDYYYIDKTWLCPLLFSALNLKDFVYILCAILVEQSVLFISKNLDVLSSCVLGFQSLLLPLKTELAVYPMLSSSELELLTSSNKMLAGYSGTLPPLIEQKLQCSIIVRLDDNSSKSKVFVNEDDRNFRSQLNLTYCVNEKIKENYLMFGQRLVYIANDRQIEAEKKIIEEIRKFVMWIINEITNYNEGNNRLDVDEACAMIKEKVSMCNQAFLCLIVRTQTFRSYFNDCRESL